MRVDRALAANALSTAAQISLRKGAEPTQTFGDLFKNALNRVTDAQDRADAQVQRYLVGDAEDLHTVTIAVTEARTMLQLAVQVRDKVVEAYRELRQMQM
jgi:flagellar hook-basal body complex protein FliE